MTPGELSEYLDDDPSGKFMVGNLASRYGWTGGAVVRNADDVAIRFTHPNGQAIKLVWNGDTLMRAVRSTRAGKIEAARASHTRHAGREHTLLRAVRGTRPGKIEAKGDAFTGPAMLQIVARWLEDTE
jgi:hypothetical protein